MLFVITNSILCVEDFLLRMDKIASAGPDRIILREKHLSYDELFLLAKRCAEICLKYDVPFSINSSIDVSTALSADIHLPYPAFTDSIDKLGNFKTIGVSVHSVSEAVNAERLGASYLIAGHIFETDCKRGLKPRGLDYLSDISHSVKIPVLGIGGITCRHSDEIMKTGAAGACVMSHFMICDNPSDEIIRFKKCFNK